MLQEFIILTRPDDSSVYIRPEDIWYLECGGIETYITISRQGISEDIFVKETPGIIFDLCNKVREAAFNPNKNPYKSIR